MAIPRLLQRTYSVLVKPAGADCNLACDYCFYRPKTALYPDTKHPRMTEATLQTFIHQYMALAGPAPSFGWQGGEPSLMGLDFYRAAVEMQKHFGRPGQVVGNGFQTNATFIDNEWATFFAAYKFLVGVSLDGPQELHDKHRLTVGAAPTWKRVMESVRVLQHNAVEFNILCMVTQESVSQAERLYCFFREQNMRFLQFIPLVEPGPEPLTPAEYSISAEAYGEFLCQLFDLWYREWTDEGGPQTYIREFDDFLTVYAGYPMPSCIHQKECGAYFVLEHNGDVYACDFMVEPEWLIGNLTVTPLAELLSSPQFRTFAKRKAAHPPECRECKWLTLCQGGCQKHRLITHESVTSPTYFCESYKRFFQHSRRRLRRMAEEITARRQGQTGKSGQVRRQTMKTTPKAARARIEEIGRNDACPCGSGRKYKHCCLGKKTSKAR